MSDFHAVRLTGIGGSDAPAALGVSRFKTPLELYLEKRGELTDVKDSPEMRWGKRLQAPVLHAFQERFPDATVRTYNDSEVLRNPAYPWMLAHLDAEIHGAVVEAKTTRSADGWGEDGSSEAPADPIVQVHHQMLVRDVQLAYIPVLIAGSDFRIIEVPFDVELGEMIKAAESELWAKVQAGTPPEPRTLADANLLYRHARPNALEATPELLDTWQALLADRRNFAEAASAVECAETAIKLAMRDCDMLTYQGKVLCTWKNSKPVMQLDIKRLREEEPVFASRYEFERPGPRRFLVKD